MPAATPRARARRNMSSVASPAMAMASETLSPAALHNSRSSSKRPRLSWVARACQAVAHSMVRGAMRIDNWPGSSAGSASAIRRARSQLTRAAAMSRLVDHAPARMCQPYAACSSPAASRCSAISAAFSSTDPGVRLLDRGGQAPVPFGAIGFQLRFVGHRADQRVAEGVLGAWGKPHLIDQLRTEQLVEHRIDPQRGEQLAPRSGRRSPTPRSTSAWPGCSAGRCAPRWPPAPWPARSPRRHPR